MDILKLIVSKYPYRVFIAQDEEITEQCLDLGFRLY
jgi:hypothetical protein